LLDDPRKADEIANRILSGKDVSDAEYRYIVMFNLVAMTQILWELAESKKRSNRERKEPVTSQNPLLRTTGGLRTFGMKLLPLLASLVAFFVGLGIGYVIP
jgi:hypothetical protein